MTAPDLPGLDADHGVLHRVALMRVLPTSARELVADAFERTEHRFGEVIVRQGEPLDALIVIASGSARLVEQLPSGDETPLDMMHEGDMVGETALLDAAAEDVVTATLRASSPCVVLRLHRSVFRALLENVPELRTSLEHAARLHAHRVFLSATTQFARLPDEALDELAGTLEPESAAEGTTVIRQDDPPGPLYVVRTGRLKVVHGEGSRRVDVAFLRKGDVFGEASVLHGRPRNASVEALDECSLLRLDTSAYAQLLERFPDLRSLAERRALANDFREQARVPLDFADEMLPATVASSSVSPERTPLQGPEAGDPVPEPPPGLDAADTRFVAPAKPLRKFPHVYQVDQMDCGAACVAMACRHFGRDVSLTPIREAVGTSVDGTSLAGIARGAEQVGLASKAVKVSKSRLGELPLPAIVHWEANHWIVLYRVEDDHVRVSDPGSGQRRIDRAEFLEKWSGYACLLAATPALADQPVAGGVGWVWQFFKPHRRTLGLALAFALLGAGLQMVVPILTQVVVDDVIRTDDRALLNVIVLALVGTLVLITAFSVLQRYVLSRTAVRIDAETLDFISSRMLALPLRYFATRRTGDIERRLAGMRQVRQFVVQSGVEAITALAQLVAALILMFIYDVVLGLVFVATIPLYGVLLRVSQKRLRPMFDSLEQAFGRYSSRQIDAIKGIETVKTMGAEGALRRLLLDQFSGLTQRLFRADFAVMLYEGAVRMITLLSLALFLWIGALRVLGGDLTLGQLVSFNALVVLANGPILVLMTMWDQLQLGSVLATRLNDILENEPEQRDGDSDLRPVPTLSGRVRFENVSFAYPAPIPVPIVKSVDLDIAPGTTVALVGRSGSGKSTIVKMIAGLLEPTDGRVLLDDVDLTTLRYGDLRRQIGFVLQESYLFDDTIKANIAFGDEEPDMERVVWAAEVASARTFIERLPLGYDTMTGESGHGFSGGQRQRIAIARALYRRPPILIFDEATSALDTESERAVKENMDQLFEGRTSFVIAHRLSTIRDADVILVVERGEIVEQGTHEELMTRKGLYYYLSSQQLQL